MRTQLFAIAAVVSLVGGCSSGPTDVVAESKDRAEGGQTEVTASTGTGGEECRAVECFPVDADKDLSFVAVEVEGCGGDVEIWLEENGERLDVEGAPHGQGKPCKGENEPSADAIKFDGLDVGHEVEVCVAVEGSSTVGSIRIVNKAGRVCEENVVGEACDDCETGTTSSATGTGGGGGAGGSGGAGGADTTTSTSTGTDTTTSTSTGTDTTTSTSGGGEGGCGGGSGEGGAATETTTATTSATTGGGDGGAGQGGMGEGGVCDSGTDTEVDTVE